jgi:hypothetical protein
VQPGERLTLGAEEETNLLRFIESELEDSLIYNNQQISEWEENSCAYKAEPRAKRKDFPWRNASNIVIPLIGITVDSVLARVVNTIFGVEPMWTVTSNVKQLGPIHKDIEEFLDWSVKTEMEMYRPVKSWCLEVIQDGWSWLKYVWEVKSHRRYVDGKWETYYTRRPRVCHVSPVDILPQVGVDDELEGDFFGQRIRWTDGQLRALSEKNVYGDVDKIISNKESLSEIRQAAGDPRQVVEERLNTGYELWLNYCFGVKKKSAPQPIVVTYHRPTHSIMRCMANPNNMGARQFIKGRFVEVRGLAQGLGLARQLMMLQDEISTLHNQQVDNATLANTRWFLGKRGVIKADTRIWPGRMLLVNDTAKDVVPMQLGEVYTSMKALEMAALSYAERRSGVSDYSLGRESSVVGDRATATGTLAILQEGNRRFDLNVRDLRDSLQRVGYGVLELNHQYRQKGMAYFVQGEKGESVERLLDLPSDFAAMGLGLELTASSGTINKQVEQASLLQLVGVLTQHMQLAQQASLMIENPQYPAATREYTAKMLEGMTQIIRRIAKTYEQRNAEDIIPFLQASEGVQGMAGQPQPGGMPGAAPGTNGTQPVPTLAQAPGNA